PDVCPDQVDGDVASAIARCGDAPEDENSEQELSEIIAIGNCDAEVAQHHRDEDVNGDDADEDSGCQFDPVDEPVHETASHALSSTPGPLSGNLAPQWRQRKPPPRSDQVVPLNTLRCAWPAP